jgi:TrmH family RNA methyltransferase
VSAVERVTSRQNAAVQHIRRLASSGKYRRQTGEFLCEGPKLWQEAQKWGWTVSALLTSEEALLCQWEGAVARAALVTPELLSYAADTQTPQKLVFTCPIPEPPERLPGGRLLVLDGVQDPGNVGTIWRTADAFGADALVLLPGCADPWSPKVVRATMGACFRLSVLRCTLKELTARLAGEQIPLYATALREDTADIRQADLRRAAVVIGSEGAGVSDQVLEACQRTLKIPMRERCESLNAAMAAGIVLWESWK